MKNIIFILTVVCISLFVYSCTKDNSQTRSDEGKIVETRAGCATSPAASYIYGHVPAGTFCCINVRYLSAYNNLPTTVTYCGTTYGPVTITGGVALLCYDNSNSLCGNIQIKVYDNFGNEIACNDFAQQCI